MKVTEEQRKKVVRTACPFMCSHGCGILAHVQGGLLVKVEPAELPRIQLWYRNPKDDDYSPGRIIASASELIPGVIEELVQMLNGEPPVEAGVTRGCDHMC